jgi:hypothetical protein
MSELTAIGVLVCVSTGNGIIARSYFIRVTYMLLLRSIPHVQGSCNRLRVTLSLFYAMAALIYYGLHNNRIAGFIAVSGLVICGLFLFPCAVQLCQKHILERNLDLFLYVVHRRKKIPDLVFQILAPGDLRNWLRTNFPLYDVEIFSSFLEGAVHQLQ